MDKKYIEILLNELNDVWSDKDSISFAGSSLKKLIEELESQQTQLDQANTTIDKLCEDFLDCLTDLSYYNMHAANKYRAIVKEVKHGL